MKRREFLLALGILALGVLACRLTPTEPRHLDLYPSQTPNATQTPLVIVEQITTTPNATQTPNVVVVSMTPNALGEMCVTANEAVYLRPAPNADYYPIDPLTKGTKVLLTGSQDGDWLFVTVGVRSGWVHSSYLGEC